MDSILERLFKAADNHGDDSGEPDHAVGDLQQLLTRACSFLSVSQMLAFLASDEVEALVEAGARGEYDVQTLMDEIQLGLFDKQQALKQAGYRWDQHEWIGWFWKKDDNLSQPFKAWQDAVDDAFCHLQRTAP